MTSWRSPNFCCVTAFQAAIFRQGGRVPARLVFRRELKARPIEFSSVLVEITGDYQFRRKTIDK
jgi:hypothetical protein